MSADESNANDELKALRQQVAEQRAISDQLQRYVADLRTVLAERDLARGTAARALRTRDDLLAQMSTDLRQPLGTIIGFAQVLLQDNRPERDRDALVRILDAGLSLDRVVEALLHRIREQLDAEVFSHGATMALGDLYAIVQQRAERLCKASGITAEIGNIDQSLIRLPVRLDLTRFRVAIDHVVLALADSIGQLSLGFLTSATANEEVIAIELLLEDPCPPRAQFIYAETLFRSIGIGFVLKIDGRRLHITLQIPTLPDSL